MKISLPPGLVQPLGVSLSLAFMVTLGLLLTTLPLVYLRLRAPRPLARLCDIAANLPLVLPPTVAGFYLILILSPTSPVGIFLERSLGLRLLFSFPGLVLASSIMGFPHMYQQLKAAMAAVGSGPIEASYSLGRGRFITLAAVVLPLMKQGILSAVILCFTRSMGEFGIALMIGGSIPGKTKTLAIALFEEVEVGNYASAHGLSLLILAIALASSFLLVNLSRVEERPLP